MRHLFLPFAAAFSFACGASFAQDAPPGATRNPDEVKAGRYGLDGSHGKVTWSVGHFGFSTYSGQITGLEGTLVLDPKKPEGLSLDIAIPIEGLSSLDDELDRHLAEPEFFDAKRFPTATFKATAVERAGPNAATVRGDLTLKGTTRPVTVAATFNQAGIHPVDKLYTVGFDGRATIRRSEFGVSGALPGVGDEVALHLEAEFKIAP